MKKLWFLLLSVTVVVGVIMSLTCKPLQDPPSRVDRIKEIAIVYNNNLPEHFNKLTPQERVFIYYLFRASLPGNFIAEDQLHRDVPKIRELLEYVLEHEAELRKDTKFSFDVDQFINDVHTYLIYLWTNHSQYFVRENSSEKRTPERLELPVLNQEHLVSVLEKLAYPDAKQVVHQVEKTLFDRSVEPTLTVPNSIDQSAVNFYSSDFTDQDFEKMSSDAQSTLNAYFYIDNEDGKRTPKHQKYSIDQKYAKELQVAVYWLSKARDHAKRYPEQFDTHLLKSLEYLITYFESGDEEFFKKHSIEWLKSNSKIDYSFGFIETYSDPKSYRAIFQSDVTIKSVDIDTLAKRLSSIEDRLPFPEQFKRDNLSTGDATMPNASINVRAFTAGSLGPLNVTLAYCLPNYEEIRSTHGSKQIIYHAEKSLGELVNPELYHRIFNSSDYYAWFEKHDPEHQLMRDIFMLEVILHETLGHGSGKLAQHTFVEGDPLTIDGKTYKVGDTIAVTSSNIQKLLAGYDQALEELRAEIIALLASILFYDEFAELGMLKQWPEKVGKQKIIELSILSMARAGLRRLILQADDATEVSGAHGRANTTITNYLIDHGAVAVHEEQITHNGVQHTVLDVRIVNVDKAIAVITELANLVQQIKSTGDGAKVRWLIETYGKKIRNIDHMKIMKQNMKAVAGDTKVVAMLYPMYEPTYDAQGEIVDIKTSWPKNIRDQYKQFKNLAFQTD